MESSYEQLLTRVAAVSVVTHHLKVYPSYLLSPLGTIFIRGGQTIADVVVIGVTWKATYEARSEGSMSSLMTVMFRNGTFSVTRIASC